MNTELRLIDRLRRLRAIIDAILNFPNIDNPGAVFTWCRTMFKVAKQVAELTNSETDDRLIEWVLTVPLATPEAFQPYYEVFRALVQMLVARDDSLESVAYRAAHIAGEDAFNLLAQNPLGVDPVTLIVVLIQILRAVFDLRRK